MLKTNREATNFGVEVMNSEAQVNRNLVTWYKFTFAVRVLYKSVTLKLSNESERERIKCILLALRLREV